MREIKFRVWDKLEKRFIYPDKGYQGHYILTLDGKFINLQNGSGGDDYVVQQYTGFKDVNGQDIYEGDIMDWGDSDRFVVTYNCSLGSWCVDGDHLSENYEALVVGNIYEA